MLIASVNEVTATECRVEIDEKVPLRYRTYSGTIGGKFVEIGDGAGCLLEFIIDPVSYVIRGITLISFDVTYQPSTIPCLPFSVGLPVICIQKGECFDGPMDAQRLEIFQKFSVGMGNDFIEIDFGDLSRANKLIKYTHVVFFLKFDLLVGIRVYRLS